MVDFSLTRASFSFKFTFRVFVRPLVLAKVQCYRNCLSAHSSLLGISQHVETLRGIPVGFRTGAEITPAFSPNVFSVIAKGQKAREKLSVSLFGRAVGAVRFVLAPTERALLAALITC